MQASLAAADQTEILRRPEKARENTADFPGKTGRLRSIAMPGDTGWHWRPCVEAVKGRTAHARTLEYLFSLTIK